MAIVTPLYSFLLSILMFITLSYEQKEIGKFNKLKTHRMLTQKNQQSSKTYEIFANNMCNLPQTPKKLAIATVTRFRATDQNNPKQGIDFFKQYLRQYAEMQCDVFDSIYVIWNNEKSPQQYEGLMERKKQWKKNVYFIHTKFNSMDHRFAFPPWVQEEVFLSLDDDAVIDCENIKQAFSQWKNHLIGGLGPIGTVQRSSRTMEYNFTEDKFAYKYWTKSYISMALPNIAIIPRHFFDLYYANLPEFQLMRNLVTKYMNCDDIGLNFMIGYIYPELRPVVLKEVKSSLRASKIQIYKTPSHKQKRNDCINQFTEIMGENTFSFSLINRKQEYKNIKQDPLRKNHCMMALKKLIIEGKYLNYDHYYENMKAIYVYNASNLTVYLTSMIDADKYLLMLDKEIRDELVQSNKVNLDYRSKHTVEDIFATQSNTGKQRINYFQSLSRINKHQRMEDKSLNENIQKLQQQFQVLKTFLIITNIILVLSFIGLVLFLCSKNRKSPLKISDQNIKQIDPNQMQSAALDNVPLQYRR